MCTLFAGNRVQVYPSYDDVCILYVHIAIHRARARDG